MNKETLTKWKEKCHQTLHEWNGLYFPPSEVLALIERLEDLEWEKGVWDKALKNYQEIFDKQQEKIERYEEALNKISNCTNKNSCFICDGIAKEALEKQE